MVNVDKYSIYVSCHPGGESRNPHRTIDPSFEGSFPNNSIQTSTRKITFQERLNGTVGGSEIRRSPPGM